MPHSIARRVCVHAGFLRWFLACAALAPIWVLLLGCAATSPTQGAGTSRGGPHIAFEKENFDFGLVPYNKEVRAEFKVLNTGDQPLVLQDVQVRTIQGC